MSKEKLIGPAGLLQSIDDDPVFAGASREQIRVLKEALSGYAKQRSQSVSKIEQSSDDNCIKFCLLGDTQLGNLCERIDVVHEAIRLCEAEGVPDLFHTGDVLDGHKVYRGQEFELHRHGWDQQSQWFKEQMPQSKTVRCHFITGNHDASFKNEAGIDVGGELEMLRPDWECLGADIGTVQLAAKDGRILTVALIHPDGGSAYSLCFDDKTGVLTKDHGFVLFKDLSKTDRVATRSPDGMFQWQRPTAYTDEHYRGGMYHFKARTFDLMVTPNHRMLVRRYATALEYSRLPISELRYPTKSHYSVDSDWCYKTAEELSSAKIQEWQMARTSEGWSGRTPEYIVIPARAPKKYASTKIKHIGRLRIEDAAELIAWYVTEGSIDKKCKQLNICQSRRVNPENHAMICDLLERVGFQNVHGRGRDEKDITVCSVELCEWLVGQCGIGSANKYLPVWLKQCGRDVIELVFDTMIRGDGCINGVSFAYGSISRRLLDDISEIGIKLGFGATRYKNVVSLSSKQNYPTINSVPEMVQYDGRVYCVTVPNGNILVQRNGRAMFSGNSYKPQKIAEQWAGGSKPDILGIGHFHKAEFMPRYRNIAICQSGACEDQTPFMARRGLASHVGFWMFEVVPAKDRKDLWSRIKCEFISLYERPKTKVKA